MCSSCFGQAVHRYLTVLWHNNVFFHHGLYRFFVSVCLSYFVICIFVLPNAVSWCWRHSVFMIDKIIFLVVILFTFAFSWAFFSFSCLLLYRQVCATLYTQQPVHPTVYVPPPSAATASICSQNPHQAHWVKYEAFSISGPTAWNVCTPFKIGF